MCRSTSSLLLIIWIISCYTAGANKPLSKGLSLNFYDRTCPRLEDIVRSALAPMFVQDPSSPAALLRLMFHDCQVQGCDASILIDRSNTPEIGANKNFGIRKRELINMLKVIIESECPKRVSCADLIVLGAREAVALSGGPRIRVPLGRRDSTYVLSTKAADASLPSADIGVDNALRLFYKLGMTTQETVAIMGAHTLGITHCLNIMNRLYNPLNNNPTNTDSNFEAILKITCPQWITSIENASFVLNDPSTVIFDNWYYKNSLAGRGILKIDSELPLHPKTSAFVQQFADHSDDFFRAFSSAFVKLSYAGVLTGNQGVIRSKCDRIYF